MAQLLALILNGQSGEDPQRNLKACKTRAKPLESVLVLVEEQTMLLQASNDNQPGFQESSLRNQSKRNGPIAGTRGLELRILQALVRKAAIPITAYD